MKRLQTTIQKTFTVKHRGKTYHIDYLNSDGQILGLINRNNWEITDEDGEELQIHLIKGKSKKEKEKVMKDLELAEKLIEFCVKHWDDYDKEIMQDFS
ncbi:MAG: hypothetical protein ABIJ05_01425 [Patescibacteria group bacterium]